MKTVFKCHHCNETISPNAKFCHGCGILSNVCNYSVPDSSVLLLYAFLTSGTKLSFASNNVTSSKLQEPGDTNHPYIRSTKDLSKAPRALPLATSPRNLPDSAQSVPQSPSARKEGHRELERSRSASASLRAHLPSMSQLDFVEDLDEELGADDLQITDHPADELEYWKKMCGGYKTFLEGGGELMLDIVLMRIEVNPIAQALGRFVSVFGVVHVALHIGPLLLSWNSGEVVTPMPSHTDIFCKHAFAVIPICPLHPSKENFLAISKVIAEFNTTKKYGSVNSHYINQKTLSCHAFVLALLNALNLRPAVLCRGLVAEYLNRVKHNALTVMTLPDLDVHFDQHWQLDEFVRTHFTPDGKWNHPDLTFLHWLETHRVDGGGRRGAGSTASSGLKRTSDSSSTDPLHVLYTSPEGLYSLLTAFDRAFWLQSGWGKHAQVLPNCPFRCPRLLEGTAAVDHQQFARLRALGETELHYEVSF
jgi:hypothetical protein